MRKLLFLVGFLVVIGGVAYATVRTDGDRTVGARGVFASDDLGVSFRYDDSTTGYVARVAPPSDAYPAEYVGTVTLLRVADAEEIPVNGDGPPAIALTVFENPLNKTAESWAQTEPWANAVTGEVMVPVKHGGALGVRYSSDGLYRADTVVLTKGSRVYVLVGMFDDQSSPMRADFTRLLETLSLK